MQPFLSLVCDNVRVALKAKVWLGEVISVYHDMIVISVFPDCAMP